MSRGIFIFLINICDVKKYGKEKVNDKGYMFRAFLGIEVPDLIRKQIALEVERLKKDLQGKPITWVNTENFHLTLRFLGDILLQQKELLLSHLQKPVSDIKSFVLELSAIKILSSNKSAVAIVLQPCHVTDITVLALTIDRIAVDAGFVPESKPYCPHLTLGRIKKKTKVLSFNTKEILKLSFPVKHINFYQSNLTNEGAIYKVLDKISLREPLKIPS